VNWYATLVLICVLGVLSVLYSRYERQHPTAASPPTTADHWYAAIGFDECGTILPNLPINPNENASSAPGFSTTGDGIIDITPHSASETGSNATLAKFVSEYPKLVLTSSSVHYPRTPLYTNGERCPAKTPDAGKVGTLRLEVWPNAQHGAGSVVSNPSAVKLTDGELIEVAFLPSHTSIPKPVAALATLLQDLATAATTTTTAPSTHVVTSTPSTVPATTATTKAASKSSSSPRAPGRP
jgi:hypothetical protein